MIKKQGNQTHNSSLINTVNPRWLNNALILNGETSIGVQGKKYLLLEMGDSKAIPLPPLVKASNRPWLAARIKK
jgi:hypothetical protein